MAAAGRVGDDRLDGLAVKAGGDIDPVVAGAAAATILGDVDLPGLGADVDEVAEVADAFRGAGVRCTVGQGEAEAAGVAEDAGSPMSNQVTPLFWVAKIRPVLELMMTSALSTGLTAKLAPPPKGHCGSGVGRPPLAWSRPKVRPT